MNLVIDAGVATKWFLPDEPFSEPALELLRQSTAGTTEFHRPRSVLFGMRQYSLESYPAEAPFRGNLAAIQLIEEVQLWTEPAVRLLESTLQIARNYDRTFYESLYLAVAAKQQAFLITADEEPRQRDRRLSPIKMAEIAISLSLNGQNSER